MHASSTDKERSIGDLVRTIIAEATLLIRQELRLAAAESKPKIARAGASLALLGIAALFAIGAFAALTTACIVALALVVQSWLAALIVTLVYALICAVAAQQGISSLQKAGSLIPSQTIQTLKEDGLVLRAGIEQAR